ncbi:2Fe-2S iron-sulfur cluster-binding protein [Photobacterium sp. 1_MG-2023]|uniref:FAD-binding oxidoreductase n=1 Tax=Photobacterium sp. 1_MG-2023 TaxID=3062646 RepID=UPI0026E2DB78|nr:2Fe-2S iron-sulfur cluster-binding protein [Photobacterium sp. 1_MG-2023]MDO6709019.1 FAD-binding oxidoreductase [Photobacterium sp. 1_MG-2023]
MEQYKVYVSSKNQQFKTDSKNTILESSLKSNITLKYGCLNGICRVCKLKLVEGDISYLPNKNVCLTKDELNENYILPCCSIAKSDIVIESSSKSSNNKIGTIVKSIEHRNSTVIIKLSVSKNSDFEFNPGQYLDVLFNGVSRSYSIANNPKADQYFELHVKKQLNGLFSQYHLECLKVNDVVWIEASKGEFKIALNKNNNALFVATGTGFSPIQSMLLSDEVKDYEKIWVLWGGRTELDFYFSDKISEIKKIRPNCTFFPVYSRATEIGRHKVNIGYVQDFLTDIVHCFEDVDVYACGSINMIESLYNVLTEHCNDISNHFYSDAFYKSGC